MYLEQQLLPSNIARSVLGAQFCLQLLVEPQGCSTLICMRFMVWDFVHLKWAELFQSHQAANG